MSKSYSESVNNLMADQVRALRSGDDAAYRNYVHEMNILAIDMALGIDNALEEFAKLDKPQNPISKGH